MILPEWLKKNNMSQVEFSRKLAVSQSTICRLCDDEPPWPERWLARKIFDATGKEVSPLDFMFVESLPPPPPARKRRKHGRKSRGSKRVDVN